jgi:hypothetical protein
LHTDVANADVPVNTEKTLHEIIATDRHEISTLCEIRYRERSRRCLRHRADANSLVQKPLDLGSPVQACLQAHTFGSIADIQNPGSYYYRSSKAALNTTMQGLAVALRPRGIGVLLLHPGWVRTRMGGNGGISPEESVRGMRNVIDEFTLEDSGCFIQYDGTELPW